MRMRAPRPDLRVRHGEYGFDGGSAQALLGAGLGSLGVMGLTPVAIRSGRKLLATLGVAASLGVLSTVPLFVYATRRGKFQVWADLLDELGWHGRERVLDAGCGRGAVMTMAAQLVPDGTVVGVDLWTDDQSGNGPAAARQNIRREGVVRQCQLTTGNLLALPFADASFDLVLSSLAIHNIDQARVTSQRRLHALDEVARVLKPGGRLVIADLMWTSAYARRLRELGMADVQQRKLGWRIWYGPWLGADLVTATMPG